jgi:IS30 family transposase
MGRRGEQRSAFRRDHDEAEEAQRYLLGATQAEIGAAMGLNQSTVSRDLKRLRERWRAQALAAMAAIERGDRAWFGLLKQAEDGDRAWASLLKQIEEQG